MHDTVRDDLWFDSGSDRCAISVLRPSGLTGTAPVIVMAHGFGSVRALRLPAYADQFVQAGYVVAMFDYRHFGDSEGTPRQLLDVRRQLEDWRNALAFVRRLDGVDADRVVAWGTSFGGGHVLTLAGTGERLAAIIAQVPHVDGIAAVRSAGLRQTLRLAPAAISDQIRALLGREPRYIDSIGEPGALAAMVSPDAAVGRDRLLDASGLRTGDFPETVAARILLHIGRYSPGKTAAKIECPALVQIATEDAITPTDVALRTARKIPHATVVTYEGGHFDPYVEPLFPRIIADQLAFLRDVVPVAR